MSAGATVTQLRVALRYEPETGKLFWLPRVPSMFPDNTCGGAAALSKAWNTRYAGKEALTGRNVHGYSRGPVFSKTYTAHQVAWALHYGEWPAQAIDHINGDRTDNRIANLRCVTVAENARNQRLRADNSSGTAGVRPSRWASRWEAHITHDYRRIHLGTFNTKEEAVAARKAAEAKYGFHPNHGLARAHTTSEGEG